MGGTMTIIYVVTSGSYSDYGIEAVFTDKNLAEKYLEAFRKNRSFSEMSIEEWPANPLGPELRQGYYPFLVRMSKEGSAVDIRPASSSYGFERVSDKTGFDLNLNMYTHIFAKDPEHAVKVAAERHAQIAALGWPTSIEEGTKLLLRLERQ
jgi:hypothetical protein